MCWKDGFFAGQGADPSEASCRGNRPARSLGKLTAAGGMGSLDSADVALPAVDGYSSKRVNAKAGAKTYLAQDLTYRLGAMFGVGGESARFCAAPDGPRLFASFWAPLWPSMNDNAAMMPAAKTAMTASAILFSGRNGAAVPGP